MKLVHLGLLRSLIVHFPGEPGEPDPAQAKVKDKKHYIFFRLVYSKDNDNFLNLFSLPADLGRVWFDAKTREIVYLITGRRKVMAVLAHILDGYDYKCPYNNETRFALKVFLKTLESAPVSIRHIPPESKLLSQFKFSGLFREAGQGCTYRIWRVRKKKNDAKYIYKEIPQDRAICEVAVFNSYGYELLLGKRAAKVRCVIDQNGLRLGTVSKLIPGFNEMRNLRETITHAELIAGKIGELLAAAYCEEENDLNSGNFGVNEEGQWVEVDGDESNYPAIVKYLGGDPEELTLWDSCKPVDVFPESTVDIDNLAFLLDARPYNWFHKVKDYKFVDYQELQANLEFKRQAYSIFLKRILIGEKVYAAIAFATQGTEQRQKLLVAHKMQRRAMLERSLLKNENFCNFARNRDRLDAIIAEFNQYNAGLKEKKRLCLQVDTEEVKQSYEALLKAIQLKDEARSLEEGMKKLGIS